MAVEIVMPRLGWTMEEGTLVEWLKKPGEAVRAGEVLLTVETDKAINEVESFDAGRLHIPEDAPAPGATVPVGTVLGYLLAEGGTAGPFDHGAAAGSGAGAAPATPSLESAPPRAAGQPTAEAGPRPGAPAAAASSGGRAPRGRHRATAEVRSRSPATASPPRIRSRTATGREPNAGVGSRPAHAGPRRGPTPGGPPDGSAPAAPGAPPPAGGTPDSQASETTPAPHETVLRPGDQPPGPPLAQQLGIDWRRVRGTGRTGRITEDDAAADQAEGGGLAE